YLFHTRFNSRDTDKVIACALSYQQRERRFTHARWPPQNDGRKHAGGKKTAERTALTQQMFLPDNLVERGWPGAVGQRGGGSACIPFLFIRCKQRVHNRPVRDTL